MSASEERCIVAPLNEIAVKALRDKAIAQKLEVQGIVPRPMTPAEFRALVTAEVKKFGEIMTRANIHAEQ